MFSSGVMVVDDDKPILRLIEAKLQSAGIECETVDSAELAIQQANKKPCSVVVSDIDMPGMNGVELISALKQHNPLVQVIMLTATPSMSRIIECADRGAVDFYSKADDLSVLIESVRAAQGRIDRWMHLMGSPFAQKSPEPEQVGTATRP